MYISNSYFDNSDKSKLNEFSHRALFIYIISLYIFEDNARFVNISKILFVNFAIITLMMVLKRRKVFINKSYIFIFGFLFTCIFSYTWSIHKSTSINKIVLLIQLISLFFLICQSLNTKSAIKISILGIGVSGVVLLANAIMIYGFKNILLSISLGIRLGNEIGQINALGRLASLSCIAILNYSLEKKKWIYSSFMIAPLIIVLATGSRNAILILLLGILYSIILRNGIKSVYRYFFIIPIVLVVGSGLIQLEIFEAIRLRFISLLEAFSTGSGDGSIRVNMIKWGLDWFISKPILGYGIGNYSELLERYIGMNTYSHNNLIELLVGIGIIGVLLYYVIYIYIFYNLYRLRNENDSIAYTLIAMIFIWFCAEAGAVNYTSKMTYVLWGISIAYIRIGRIERLKRRNVSERS